MTRSIHPLPFLDLDIEWWSNFAHLLGGIISCSDHIHHHLYHPTHFQHYLYVSLLMYPWHSFAVKPRWCLVELVWHLPLFLVRHYFCAVVSPWYRDSGLSAESDDNVVFQCIFYQVLTFYFHSKTVTLFKLNDGNTVQTE